MRHLSRAADSVVAVAGVFDPRGRSFAVGRSLLAAATLSVLVFTPSRGLFVYTPENPAGVRCGGARVVALWCIGPQGQVSSALRLAVAGTVLAAVVIGLCPRWTCVPHWYITFSLGTTMTQPNGGESVARIVALLIIPMCLGDDRIRHWRRPSRELAPTWRGAAFAAHLFLRIQVSLIYLSAVVAKLSVPAWRDGTFMYQVFHDPYYRPPALLRSILGSGLDSTWLVAAVTWGTIAAELAIALSMVGGRRARRCGLLLAVCLHGMIIVTLGLFSFGLTMIALLVLASADGAAMSADPGPRRRVSWLPGRAAPSAPAQPTAVTKFSRADTETPSVG